MNWYKRLLIHDITIWEPGGTDRYGDPTYTKTFVKGRWQAERERFVTEEGEEKVSSTVVFLDREVSESAYLYKGKSDEDDPEDQDGAKPVEGIEITYNIPGNLREIRAILT